MNAMTITGIPNGWPEGADPHKLALRLLPQTKPKDEHAQPSLSVRRLRALLGE